MPDKLITDIILTVKVNVLHSWQVSTTEAIDLQRSLAGQVMREGEISNPRYIAGVDISVPRAGKMGTGAVVVLRYPELEVVATEAFQTELTWPYIPGLLSFREAPIILPACEKLDIIPDLVMVDGQGIAHPRRLGLASHLGLFLDTPTIGCAKSLLCGTHEEPEDIPGSYAELSDNDEVTGAVLRTRFKVKPVYVSIGHKISLKSAIGWVLKCCRGYRLPEPTRLAHLAAGERIQREKIEVRAA